MIDIVTGIAFLNEKHSKMEFISPGVVRINRPYCSTTIPVCERFSYFPLFSSAGFKIKINRIPNSYD